MSCVAVAGVTLAACCTLGVAARAQEGPGPGNPHGPLPAARARAGIAARLDASPAGSGPTLTAWPTFRLRYGLASRASSGARR